MSKLFPGKKGHVTEDMRVDGRYGGRKQIGDFSVPGTGKGWL